METIEEINAPLVKGILFYLDKIGLKHGALAKRAGYSIQELSYMINGRKIIKGSDVIKISQALNVTPNDIYEKSGLELNHSNMRVGALTVKEILVTKDDELIVSISSQNVIELDGYKVICVPSDY